MTAESTTSPAPGRLLLGLIGAGIQGSLTPALQEAEAACQGLRMHYQLIDLDRGPLAAERLPLLMEAVRTIGFSGLNITFPCKQAVIPLLDGLSEEAEAIGAVNTVVAQGGRLVGHNTDASGWAWGFRRALPDADLACVVLLGAGGAGAAIAHALLRLGAARLRVVDIDSARSRALVAALSERYAAPCEAWTDVAQALQGASGLVHATPTGMAKLPGLPLPAHLLSPALWVSEIVYFPLETELLRAARAAGCATVDGGAMAVGQAVDAFQLFTGSGADAARMAQHFRQLVADGGHPKGSAG